MVCYTHLPYCTKSNQWIGHDSASCFTLQALLKESLGHGGHDWVTQMERDLGRSLVQPPAQSKVNINRTVAQGFVQLSMEKLLQCLVVHTGKIVSYIQSTQGRSAAHNIYLKYKLLSWMPSRWDRAIYVITITCSVLPQFLHPCAQPQPHKPRTDSGLCPCPNAAMPRGAGLGQPIPQQQLSVGAVCLPPSSHNTAVSTNETKAIWINRQELFIKMLYLHLFCICVPQPSWRRILTAAVFVKH